MSDEPLNRRLVRQGEGFVDAECAHCGERMVPDEDGLFYVHANTSEVKCKIDEKDKEGICHDRE